jgi:hypothetical protein
MTADVHSGRRLASTGASQVLEAVDGPRAEHLGANEGPG